MLDQNSLPLPDLFSALVKDEALGTLIELARAEDLGFEGDITSASITPPGARARAAMVARCAGVVCGQRVGRKVIESFSAKLEQMWLIGDGERCAADGWIAEFEGNLLDLLRVERTLLNFVSRLSGIATLSDRFVSAVAGTPAIICDTRKTTPGWRGLEKYAVRCGGAAVHRAGLFDAVLYKDNHLAGLDAGDLPAHLETAIRRARAKQALRFVEVEVDSLARLEAVLSIAPGLVDIILLDNMETQDLRAAVDLRNSADVTVLLEASGGVTLANVRAIAETGVDRIAVGALTHSAPALDIGLDLELASGNGG